jgi:transposase-like protein
MKVSAEWKYSYRTVGSTGQTFGFILSTKREVSTAKRFFKKLMGDDHRRLPFTVGTDKHASYPEAFAPSVKEKVLNPLMASSAALTRINLCNRTRGTLSAWKTHYPRCDKGPLFPSSRLARQHIG